MATDSSPTPPEPATTVDFDPATTVDLDLAFAADEALPPELIQAAGPWADPLAGAEPWHRF